MGKKKLPEKVLRRFLRGREFERREKISWTRVESESPEFEAATEWKGRRGRVDVRLDHSELGHIVLVEIKATDWDAMRPHRVRPNALRHARQLWRYIEAHLTPEDVVAALVYPVAPEDESRRREVESILGDRLIQVVWRDTV